MNDLAEMIGCSYGFNINDSVISLWIHVPIPHAKWVYRIYYKSKYENWTDKYE